MTVLARQQHTALAGEGNGGHRLTGAGEVVIVPLFPAVTIAQSIVDDPDPRGLEEIVARKYIPVVHITPRNDPGVPGPDGRHSRNPRLWQ